MDKHHTAHYNSEIGTIEIVGTGEGIVSLGFVDEPDRDAPDYHQCLEPCLDQLDEYFHGKRRVFNLSLFLQGTSFQKKVWKALLDIPYGTTQSYADIARKIDNPNAFRAVGNANNKNNIAIIIPCHRVIGSDGHLIGYASGLWRKEWLLAHESKNL
jgi:methylated-DNA-[protein]-cysteine S-methyltransferase